MTNQHELENTEALLPKEDFQKKILDWFQEHKRTMPWRETPLPYYIWISEIMLQQTRVDTVIPYFYRFIEKYDTVKALANAEDETLLKLWEGLGYYNRVRNLKVAAGEIMERHGGEIPENYEDLLKLKGIGEYTAGAISSEAFGKKEIAVDGNVYRVMARLLGIREDLKKPSVMKKIKEEVRGLLPDTLVGDFNQGLIELGALVCIPNGSPKCGICPVKDSCTAYKENLQDEIPLKVKKKERREEERTVLIFRHEGRYGIRKREEGALLAGLYEFYHEEGHYDAHLIEEWVENLGGRPSAIYPLKDKKFLFTHILWKLKAFVVELEAPLEDLLFLTREEIKTSYSLATAFRDYFEELGENEVE